MNTFDGYVKTESLILNAWHRIMRTVTFRGAPRMSSLLCRQLLPEKCVTRSSRGFDVCAITTDYNEACALCGCLSRHLINLLHSFLLPGDVFIDGGANIGQFTLLAAQRVGSSGKVIAYEPNPVVASRLRLSCKLNRYDWVSVRQAALGDMVGVMPFYVANNSQLSSLFLVPPRLGNYTKINVGTVRLQDELDIFNIRADHIAIIKLDLEGGEFEALQGMRTILDNSEAPAFLIELNTTARSDGRQVVAYIMELFASLNYKGFIVRARHFHIGDRPPSLASLVSLHSSPLFWVDALFVKTGTRVHQRLAPLIGR